MPALQKVPVQFDWSGVRSSTSDRKIQFGELTEEVNVRYPLDGGAPQKRFGHSKTTTSLFVGADYAGPATEMLAAPTVMWRDSADQLWARDGASAYFRGKDLRAFPTWQRIQNLADYGGAHKPLHAVGNGDLFEFTLGVKVGAGTGYQVTVLDPSTGVVKLETSKIAANGILSYAVATDANGVVWLFWVDGGASIYAHHYNGPTDSPVLTTYTTQGGQAFVDIDARLLSATGELAVVAMSAPGGGAGNLNNFHGYLNSTTGAAKTSPAPVLATFAGPGVGAPICAGGISVMSEDGSAGLLRYSFWRAKNSTDVQLMAVTASGATLVTTSTTELFAEASTTDVVAVCSSGGFIDPTSGAEVYVSSTAASDANGAIPLITSAVTREHVVTGSVATTVVARSAYLAARPFEVNGAWYFVTGFDDGPVTRAQRGYFLRSSDGTIVTSILDGQGAAAFHAGGLVLHSDPSYNYNILGSSHTVTPVVLDDGTTLVPLLQEGFTAATPAPTLVSIDFSADYYSDALNITTGGVPKYVSPQDVVRELAPIHFPYEDAVITDGDGTALAGATLFTWLYATLDSSGRVTRTANKVPVSQNFHDFLSVAPTLDIPTLRHTIGPTWIELYGTMPGDPDLFLQQQIPNDPTVDSIHLQIDPASWNDAGELLYTTGNALPNTSVPPARLSVVWRDRNWLAGTAEDDIWPSRESIPGHGWEYNPALAFEWHDGTGPVTAICPLGWDALAIFRRDAIGLIQGAGPDGNAQGGSYQVSTITTRKGVANPHAVVQGPAGVYFQNAADGRMCLLSLGGVQEINQGQESYTSYAPTAAVHVESERAIRFPCDNGRILVLDYEHPFADQPQGRWIRYENTSLPAAVGARLIDGAFVMLEAGTSGAAATWTPIVNSRDNGVVCLVDWTTGRMAPANFLGEFDVDEVTLSSTRLENASVYRYTLTDDQGNEEVHDDVADTTSDVTFRSALFRTREVRLRVTEVSSNGFGRVFDGVVMIVRPYGRVQNPYRRIA